MARFLRKARRRRCYFCHLAGANEAYYTNICLRHQALISLRLLVLLARRGRFGKCWQIVRWGR